MSKECGRCEGEVEEAIFVNNDPTVFVEHKVLKEEYNHLCKDCIKELKEAKEDEFIGD